MNYLRKKLLHLIPVLLAVTVITFLFVNLLPGDVAYVILGEMATPESIAAVQKDLHLDDPLPLRYMIWLGSVLQGDLGRSFITQEPVLEAILSRLPVTLELMVLTQVMALILSVPLGVFTAYREGGRIDRSVAGITFGLLSVPSFMMAIVLIYFFAVNLHVLPATGYVPLSESIWGNLRTFLLPSLTLALIEWCALMRVLRADMIATLRENYILMAKAKGMSTARILFGHALKPSSFTVLTLFGLTAASLISGSLVVETIFALPGIGRLLVTAIYTRDFIMVQGVTLFAALGFVIVNLSVDMLYAMLDPRIRHDSA